MAISKSQARRIQMSRKRVSAKKEDFLLKPVEPTKRQAIRYRKILTEAIDRTKDAVMQLYNSTDDLSSIDSQMEDLFSRMDWWDELAIQVGENVTELDEYHAQAYYHTITTSTGVNVAGYVQETGLEELLNTMIEDNVNKALELKPAQQKRLSDIIKQALTGQESKSGKLKNKILNSFDVTENTAKFLARDQTQRDINGLNRFRQERTGIKKYKWVTSKDERVRATHRKMNGLEVNWESGIILKSPLSVKRGLAGKNVNKVAGGHIGQDYQCRCTAKPILEV